MNIKKCSISVWLIDISVKKILCKIFEFLFFVLAYHILYFLFIVLNMIKMLSSICLNMNNDFNKFLKNLKSLFLWRKNQDICLMYTNKYD